MALKKNNEEGAKMYLMSASQKKNEGKSFFIFSLELSKNCSQNGHDVR
jgi:hypothetical protein